MRKKIFASAAAGAIVLLVWTFLLNVVFGFSVRFNMKHLSHEREVYAILKATVTEPGRYLCNPPISPEGRFPENEPVFGIQYSGIGHESAAIGEVLDLVIFLIATSIGAWMLSVTSERYRSRFINRLWFFAGIGLLLAVTGDLGGFGIGGSPLDLSLLMAARTVVTWTIVGLAVAWIMRPARLTGSTEKPARTS